MAGEVKAADDALDAGWVSPGDLEGMPVSKNTLKILKTRGFISS
jgi:hypothetical protein